jgi:hypothetical protein
MFWKTLMQVLVTVAIAAAEAYCAKKSAPKHRPWPPLRLRLVKLWLPQRSNRPDVSVSPAARYCPLHSRCAS